MYTGDSKLSKTVDAAIARRNTEVVRRFCGHCLGTGRLFMPQSNGTYRRTQCGSCGGSGRRTP